MKYISLLVGAFALLTPVFAQTWTTCNPMNTTCPNDPALGTNHTFVFNSSSSVTDTFNITAGSLIYAENGTQFVINKKGDSPTIQSQFYIFWGSVSVIMQAAYGQGIVSSIVLESDDLDEVDWEIMGGNGTTAETNYFGKGNTTLYNRAIYYGLPGGADPRAGFHNYTTLWTSAQLEWYIDGELVRTLAYGDADGGYNYPQTPMTVRMGIWAGGDSDNSNGTIEWAGGLTDYDNGPYTMTIQSATINDFSSGSAYQWTDKTGSFESIKVLSGNSTAAVAIAKADTVTNTPSIAQKFAALPSTTKLAIYCSSGAAAALLLSAAIFSCIRARRAGKREREAYEAKVEKEREEAYKDQMELREKGIGGWDDGAYAKQGDDALGGWGGTHVPPGTKATDFDFPDVKNPADVAVQALPSRVSSPAIPRVLSPTIPRVMSPVSRLQSPQIVQPIPQSPRAWTGGNSGGMIHQAGNAYSGAYGGSNVSRSPSFPLTQPAPAARGYPGGYTSGGYQRF